MSKESWLSRTNQVWKLLVFIVGGVTNFLVFLLLIWRINHEQGVSVIPDEFSPAALLVYIGASTFLWFPSFSSMLELQEEYYEIRFNFITVWQLVFHSGGFEALPSLRRLKPVSALFFRAAQKGSLTRPQRV